MIVAWVQWLFTTFGCDQQITPELIGRVAYEAEVVAQNSPGGKMDQYTSAIGDIIYLETDAFSKHHKIDTAIEGLIIGESGVSKNTVGVLGDIKGKSLEAIAMVQKEVPTFELPVATLEAYEMHKALLPADLQPFFYAAIQNHMITQEALFALSEKEMNYQNIGRLLNAHHEVLKNTLKITVPVIDAMIDAALKAGAYGAKIVGSGGGGCICALAPIDKQQAVIEAIQNAGAKDAYSVHISKGAHIL
jgi:galactokinase